MLKKTTKIVWETFQYVRKIGGVFLVIEDVRNGNAAPIFQNKLPLRRCNFTQNMLHHLNNKIR